MSRAQRSATPPRDHSRLLTLGCTTPGHGSLVPLTTTGGWTPLTVTPDTFFMSLYSLGHGAHGGGHRQQVVAAEVDLCQRGNVADGQRELAEVVVGQVEAPQAGKSEKWAR